mmetsp:Transcript_7809/g.19954  ORF Transcript_7809/g.19954 Transcript_7809/m.19954 type:complete len:313 (-) Transcript_7809:293-1231(-)
MQHARVALKSDERVALAPDAHHRRGAACRRRGHVRLAHRLHREDHLGARQPREPHSAVPARAQRAQHDELAQLDHPLGHRRVDARGPQARLGGGGRRARHWEGALDRSGRLPRGRRARRLRRSVEDHTAALTFAPQPAQPLALARGVGLAHRAVDVVVHRVRLADWHSHQLREVCATRRAELDLADRVGDRLLLRGGVDAARRQGELLHELLDAPSAFLLVAVTKAQLWPWARVLSWRSRVLSKGEFRAARRLHVKRASRAGEVQHVVTFTGRVHHRQREVRALTMHTGIRRSGQCGVWLALLALEHSDLMA